MKILTKYAKFVPYLYFIAITIYWFTHLNRTEGLTAYPILLFGIPFLWQVIKPNKNLNLTLGITFVCLSSYLVIAYISNIYYTNSLVFSSNNFILYGGLFVAANFFMALWIIKNSLDRAFQK